MYDFMRDAYYKLQAQDVKRGATAGGLHDLVRYGLGTMPPARDWFSLGRQTGKSQMTSDMIRELVQAPVSDFDKFMAFYSTRMPTNLLCLAMYDHEPEMRAQYE